MTMMRRVIAQISTYDMSQWRRTKSGKRYIHRSTQQLYFDRYDDLMRHMRQLEIQSACSTDKYILDWWWYTS